MYTFDDFEADRRRDECRLRRLDREMDNRISRSMAINTALSEHPVVRYVKELPVESTLYPAIEYLRQSNDEERSIVSNNQGMTVQETGFQENDGLIEDRDYITWCMPGHDLERPLDKGCGFIRSKSGDIVFTACPSDHEHHIKGKRIHCWSLRCPQCMNDTALKGAHEIEKNLLSFATLKRKQNDDQGDIGHWVVSPPQDFAKMMVQTRAEFDWLSKYVGDSMFNHGATAGVTIFHPWRQQEDMWKFSPHFHLLCYGRIDTTSFREENPGWIIKKVHPREKIRSIHHTAAYLMTHMGLGMSERDASECDLSMKLLNHFVPGLVSGKDSRFSDKDIEDMCNGKGRMVGDLSDIDWFEWVKEELYKETRIRYWGGVARNNIQVVEIVRQYKIRVCKECGTLLRTYDGFDDTQGQYVRYICDIKVRAFARDMDIVRTIFLQYKERLRSARMDMTELAAMIPYAVSAIEFTEPNDDLIMDGPFEEPDSYFLRRQRMAFGEESVE